MTLCEEHHCGGIYYEEKYNDECPLCKANAKIEVMESDFCDVNDALESVTAQLRMEAQPRLLAVS